MAKQVLDLYMLYKLVVEKGGLVEGKDLFFKIIICLNWSFSNIELKRYRIKNIQLFLK